MRQINISYFNLELEELIYMLWRNAPLTEEALYMDTAYSNGVLVGDDAGYEDFLQYLNTIGGPRQSFTVLNGRHFPLDFSSDTVDVSEYDKLFDCNSRFKDTAISLWKETLLRE